SVGDYIAVDRWMLILRPNFFPAHALTVNLTAAQVGKFARDPHLALLYQDATFSLYRVMSTPPRRRANLRYDHGKVALGDDGDGVIQEIEVQGERTRGIEG